MSNELNVLSLEDSVLDFEIICKQLTEEGFDFKISRVEKETDFEASLRREQYDIILADFKLPGFDAFGALNIRNNLCPDIPFICVSGSIGEETAIELLKSGASDYVLKDKPARLPFAINRALDEANKRIIIYKAEEQIRVLSKAIDGAYDCFVMVNPNGDVTYANESSYTVFGYSAAEMLKLNIAQFDVNPKKVENIRKEMNNKGYWSGETICLKKNKQTFPVILSTSFLKDDKGQVVGMLGVFRDISTIKKAEEELKKSKKSWEGIFNGLSQPTVILDVNHNILEMNDSLRKKLDKSDAELKDLKCWEIFHDHGTNCCANGCPFEELIASDMYESTEKEMEAFGGFYIVNCAPILDTEGKLEKVIHIATDITDRKLIEKALSKSEASYRKLIETEPDCVIVLSEDNIIQSINPAGIAMVEADCTEQLAGKSIIDLIDFEYRKAFINLNQLVFSGESGVLEFKINGLKGTIRWIESHSAPMYDENGNIFSMLSIARDITDFKEAVENLRLSEIKFRNIFEISVDAISVSKSGFHVFFNPAYLALFGYTNYDELYAKPVIDIIAYGEQDRIADFTMRREKGDIAPTSYECRGRRKDGSEFDVDVKTTNYEINNEIYSLVILRDITERKKAEKTINLLAHAIRSISECVSITDIDNNIIFVNDAFLNTYKYEEHEIIGKNIVLVRSSNNPTEIVDEILPSSIAGSWQGELINKRKDGKEFPIFLSTSVIRDENDKAIAFIGVATDITERKLEEHLLVESEKKYRTMLNASPDGILLINLKGIITEASEIGIELLGYENIGGLIGKHILHFVPADEKNTCKEIIKKTINEGIAQNIEIKILKKNQSLFLSEMSSTLIQDQHGSPLFYMIIFRNISHRKKIEAQQIHADRMATLGEMATSIAHEINQPLNIISMTMDKVLFDAAKTNIIDNDYLKTKSDKIFENILRIKNIIDHIRSFSRSNNDYITIAFNINDSINNAISLMKEQFKHLEIILDLQLNDDIPRIVGNTFKFEQIIINMLVNAKDAIIEKKAKQIDYDKMIIGIRTYHEKQFLIIEISDNGIGISNENLNKITLPFFTTKDEGKGTGLGLTICYQIIKDMGGSIEISSDILYGTKIKIMLTI